MNFIAGSKSLTKGVIFSMNVLSILTLTGQWGQGVQAEVVPVNIHAVENTVEIDNKGTKYASWNFDGAIPGPVVRVKEGDIVDFTLLNDKTNQKSHSMDFHAAVADVLNEFSPDRKSTPLNS